MTLHTITLARPRVLPQNPDCDCCAGHLVEALRERAGVAEATLDPTGLILKIDSQVVADAEAERLACDAGRSVAQRYDHPVFAVEGLDCADCARTFERAVARMEGVHYAILNFAAARLRLEYDRARTSVEAIVALGGQLGYALRLPQQSSVFACSVVGMCCAVEARPIEQAVRALPGIQQVMADPALARLTVIYDPQSLAASQIVDQVARLGFDVTTDPGLRNPDEGRGRDEGDRRPTTDDRRQDQAIVYRLSSIVPQRPRDRLTVLCGLLIAAAWVGGLLGAPAGVSAALYVLATLAGGVFVARSGWATLRATRTLDINLLMTVAALGALLIGEYAEGAAVMFLFALGNALEGYTIERARRSIRALMQLAPATALVLRDGVERALPVGAVAAGQVIVIRPGDRVPLDAVVLAGESAVDQAPITGESVPVAKAAGAELFAGSINGAGALEARVKRPAQDSTLARIIHLVEEAQSQKSRAQRFIDVFARYYTPAVIGLAVLVALLPPLLAGGGWADWFYRALVLLVVSCPCALVISTPVSIVSAISAAARAGVLFKGGAALEAAGGLKAIAFDKTGTLTIGRPVVTDIIADCRLVLSGAEGLRIADCDAQSTIYNLQSEMLRLAAAVERRSTHPLARAVVAAAEERGLSIPAAADVRSSAGRGASATVEGRTVTIGNRLMFEGAPLAPQIETALADLERAGRTAMLVGYDGVPRGLIGAADQPRAESRATVDALRRQGIAHIAMLTGDAALVAAQVGAATGVGEVRAGLLPDAKLAAIGELLARHGSVGMVGDGVNDAPALARATIGIAMGAAGSDAALETADVTLMADDLTRLPFAIGLSRSARRVIAQNVAFALAVKAIFLVATLLG
ncbi:MAG TPA: heavy metal translocating P-type ATPase, partial [Roseiflexaceae bacterium]